jgi:hypothetical protein
MRSWWATVVVAAVCCALEATAAAAQQAAQSGQIQLRDDKFSPYREYTTGPVRAGTYPNLAVVEFVGRIDRQSGVRTTRLRVELAYLSAHKRGYEAARNSRAQPLGFTKVASNRRCEFGATACVHSEVFTVEIPEAELRQAAPEGYQLKAFARNGPGAVAGISKSQIVALFARIDADRLAKAKPGPKKAN